MEVVLTRETGTEINVICDGRFSHRFDLQPLILVRGKEEEQLLGDPVAYGKRLHNALFAPQTLARHALDALPERLVLTTMDDELDAIPWEYLSGAGGFLIHDYPFVRGLPTEQRLPPPALDTGLQIIVVPAQPLSKDIAPLNVDADRQLVQRVRGSVFLVTLNACESAAPDETPFSNLAAALARQRIPYALGMRFPIHDDDVRLFARAFYNDLARGTSVEEALLQARLALEKSARPWVVGVPVLYTSLAAPAAGFVRQDGRPLVVDWQPPMEISALPRAEGAFEGRIDDLIHLGTLLTGDQRPRVLTIHGAGGQGKTALAREVVERFAFAWPGGVWAISLEHLPDRGIFVNALARFLAIPTQEMGDPDEVERQVHARLASRCLLIVLDNAETLVDAVFANDAQAINLAQFIQQLPSDAVSLLVTSRIYLGWPGEVEHELGGLSPRDGVHLFMQSAPQRRDAIERGVAEALSQKVEGRPLSLRLLGGAFNNSALPLLSFVFASEQPLNATCVFFAEDFSISSR